MTASVCLSSDPACAAVVRRLLTRRRLPTSSPTTITYPHTPPHITRYCYCKPLTTRNLNECTLVQNTIKHYKLTKSMSEVTAAGCCCCCCWWHYIYVLHNHLKVYLFIDNYYARTQYISYEVMVTLSSSL